MPCSRAVASLMGLAVADWVGAALEFLEAKCQELLNREFKIQKMMRTQFCSCLIRGCLLHVLSKVRARKFDRLLMCVF